MNSNINNNNKYYRYSLKEYNFLVERKKTLQMSNKKQKKHKIVYNTGEKQRKILYNFVFLCITCKILSYVYIHTHTHTKR